MNRLAILAMALAATAHGDGNVTAEARRVVHGASDDPDRAEAPDPVVTLRATYRGAWSWENDRSVLYASPPPLPYRPRLVPSAGGARLFGGPSIDPKAKKAKRKAAEKARRRNR